MDGYGWRENGEREHIRKQDLFDAPKVFLSRFSLFRSLHGCALLALFICMCDLPLGAGGPEVLETFPVHEFQKVEN